MDVGSWGGRHTIKQMNPLILERVMSFLVNEIKNVESLRADSIHL